MNRKIINRKSPMCPVCHSAKFIKVRYEYTTDILDVGSFDSFKVFIKCDNCHIESIAESKNY